MLILNRNLTPGEVRTCKLSGEMIIYGDYYYQDTDDPNLYIKASEYHKLKREEEERKFDYSLLEQAKNELEYKNYLQRAEQQLLSETILKKEILVNGKVKNISITKEE